MLPGLLVRPSWRRLAWCAVGTAAGATLMIMPQCMMVDCSIGPPVPRPALSLYGPGYLEALLPVGLMATLAASGQPRRLLLKVLAPLAACGVLGLVGLVLAENFVTSEYRLMDPWEALTVLVGGPCYGLVLWGMLDLGKAPEKPAEA
jgi:hypothetical protein